jgi:hypothetical protein
MLQPVNTRPSPQSSAEPTLKFEYLALACSRASRAASTKASFVFVIGILPCVIPAKAGIQFSKSPQRKSMISGLLRPVSLVVSMAQEESQKDHRNKKAKVAKEPTQSVRHPPQHDE